MSVKRYWTPYLRTSPDKELGDDDDDFEVFLASDYAALEAKIAELEASQRDCGATAKDWHAALDACNNANLALEAKCKALEEALTELHALVCGECPSLINEDSGGDGALDMRIRAALRAQETGEVVPCKPGLDGGGGPLQARLGREAMPFLWRYGVMTREQALEKALTNCDAALDTEHERHMSEIPAQRRYPVTAIHAYNEAKAALSAAPPRDAEGWRPMETAPRDGRMLQLGRADHGGFVGKGQWMKTSQRWGWDLIAQPTHWQPLPAPPASKEPR